MSDTNSPKLDPLATADSQETISAEIDDISSQYNSGFTADPANQKRSRD